MGTLFIYFKVQEKLKKIVLYLTFLSFVANIMKSNNIDPQSAFLNFLRTLTAWKKSLNCLLSYTTLLIIDHSQGNQVFLSLEYQCLNHTQYTITKLNLLSCCKRLHKSLALKKLDARTSAKFFALTLVKKEYI